MTDASESLESRIGERLRAIRDRQLLRTLRPPTGFDFSSNDYLGLAAHPRLQARHDRRRRAARLRQHRIAAAARRARGVLGGRTKVRRLQAHRTGALFLERLPRQPRRPDDAAGDRRRHLFGRAESRQPRRRRPAVGRLAAWCFHTTISPSWRGCCAAGHRTGTHSSSPSRCSAWTAMCRPSRSTPPSADRPAPRSSWMRRMPSASVRRGRQRTHRGLRHRTRRVRVDQHGGQGAGRERRLRRRPMHGRSNT